jgi:hypothetical protein
MPSGLSVISGVWLTMQKTGAFLRMGYVVREWWKIPSRVTRRLLYSCDICTEVCEQIHTVKALAIGEV